MYKESFEEMQYMTVGWYIATKIHYVIASQIPSGY